MVADNQTSSKPPWMSTPPSASDQPPVQPATDQAVITKAEPTPTTPAPPVTPSAIPPTPPKSPTGDKTSSWMETVAGKVATAGNDPVKTEASSVGESESETKPPWMVAETKESTMTKVAESPIPGKTKETPSEPTSKVGQTPPSPPEGPPATPDLKGPTDSPFKKLIPIIIGLAILGLIVFGIIKVFKLIKPAEQKPPSDQPPIVEQQEPITLTWWGLWEPRSVVSQVILDYQRSKPTVTINYVQQSHKDYRERLQSALARNEGPDIFRFHNTWVSLLRKDLSSVPTSLYSPSDFEATFYPVANKDLKVGSGHVGIPLMFDGLAFFYNRTMLEEKEIEVPTTWEQFRKVAAQLTQWDEEGKILVAGAALGTTSNIDNFSDILALLLLQNGADLTKPTSQLAQDALSFYTLFTTQDRVWDKTLPASYYAFATGKVAMILAPSWRALEIKATAPDLKFGVAPVPQLPGTKVTWASYWVEGVFIKSKYQTEAWEFLKYLSEKEALQKFYSTAAADRGMGEIYPRKDLADLLKDDPVVGAFIQQAETAQSWYMCSQTHDNGINDRIIKYYEDAVNAVIDGQPIDQSLETAAQGIQQVLLQYKVSR